MTPAAIYFRSMYVPPQRDALPPRPRRGRALLLLAVLILGGAIFLALQPELVQRQAARLFPSPTPTPPATPGAAELAATATAA